MNKFLVGVAALAVAVPALAQMPAAVAPQAPMATPYLPRAPMAPMGGRPQTRDQVIAKVRDHFARMDINRDGFVGEAEMESMRAQHQGRRQAMKADRGNRLAMRDGPRGGGQMRDPAAAFDRLDANRDGMISRDEFGKAREMRMERKVVGGAPGAMQHGGNRRMMKMHRMGGMGGGRMLRMADIDKDGRVSLQEATTSALQHFDRVDANRDGQITPDERRQQRQQHKAMPAPKAG